MFNVDKEMAKLQNDYSRLFSLFLKFQSSFTEVRFSRKLEIGECWIQGNYLSRIMTNILKLEAISIRALQAIDDINKNKFEYYSFYEPLCLAEIWYYKAFNIISVFEYLQKLEEEKKPLAVGQKTFKDVFDTLSFEKVDRDHSEIKNITIVRNQLIEHSVNHDENSEVVTSQGINVDIGSFNYANYEIYVGSLSDRKGIVLKDDGLFVNNRKFLSYFTRRLEKFNN